MKTSGIYLITVNCFNGDKFYIGQSVNMHNRKLQHLSHLRSGKSKCLKLQRAFSKYGEKSISFLILEEVSASSLLAAREKYWLDRYLNEFGNVSILNLCLKEMSSVLGIKRTDETKLKMSNAAKSRAPMSEIVRLKISETKRRLNQKPSALHMEKLRNIAMGRRSTEHVEKLAAMKRGTKKPAEEIARRQAARLANAITNGKVY
jgi:group I intron endonuclease